jgi:hypothetical protein
MKRKGRLRRSAGVVKQRSKIDEYCFFLVFIVSSAPFHFNVSPSVVGHILTTKCLYQFHISFTECFIYKCILRKLL